MLLSTPQNNSEIPATCLLQYLARLTAIVYPNSYHLQEAEHFRWRTLAFTG